MVSILYNWILYKWKTTCFPSSLLLPCQNHFLLGLNAKYSLNWFQEQWAFDLGVNLLLPRWIMNFLLLNMYIPNLNKSPFLQPNLRVYIHLSIQPWCPIYQNMYQSQYQSQSTFFVDFIVAAFQCWKLSIVQEFVDGVIVMSFNLIRQWGEPLCAWKLEEVGGTCQCWKSLVKRLFVKWPFT